MEASKTIQQFAVRLARAFGPERIVLFGSHADGTAGPDSDVDLFVEMEVEGSTAMKALDIRRAIPHSFPLDLVVRTPQDTRRRLAENDFFVKSILQDGKILYEKHRSRVAGQG